jgi:hypothetical protein
VAVAAVLVDYRLIDLGLPIPAGLDTCRTVR